MKESKTYSLRNALIVTLIISFGFVAANYIVSVNLERFQQTLLPDAGASWYYWKLPKAELWATITMWVFYAAHQIIVWVMIWRFRGRPFAPKGRITKLNMWLLVVNAFFIVVHLLQTLFFYDALAQFVPIMTSQGSVIVMLVMILIMLNQRRGLFFGKKVPLPKGGTGLITKVHGFFIAWAVIYTFWFHPFEGSPGHILGFFYAFMLLVQLSLAKTSWHMNIKWITLLEVYVAFHGAIVAIGQANGIWPMFFFGFMMMFIVTQVYGILKNKIALVGIIVCYAALVLLTYGGVFANAFTGTDVGWADIHQITWIPLILYGLVFVLVFIMQAVSLLGRKRDKNAD